MIGAAAGAPGWNITALGLAAATFWGLSDFLGGMATRRVPAFFVVWVAHTLSLLPLVAIALNFHLPFPGSRTTLYACLTGVCGGLALILFYQALAVGEMGLIAALTGVLTAVIPVLVSFLTEGRPKPTQILGFLIAVAAIWCIGHQPGDLPHPRGFGLATLAGIGFGVFLVGSKIAGEGGLLWPLACSRMASAAVAAFVLLSTTLRKGSSQKHGMQGSLQTVLLLAGSAGLIEAAGNLFYMMATRVGRMDVAAVLSSLYPAVTILLAIGLLKERATGRRALGMGLALTAVVVISV
jgi:uncharacterized membrane protein